MSELIPRVGVGAIILSLIDDSAHILLGLRLNKEGHGHEEWAFPGGKLDWGETITQCAIRETKEEAGIDIIPIAEIGFTNDFWPSPINKHYLTVYVHCNLRHIDQTPKVCEPEKCRVWQWFPLGAMPKNMMLGASEILNKWFPLDFKQVS